MQCSLKAVQTAIYNYKVTGSFKDKERWVRPRITTSKQERIVHCLSSSDRRLTAVDIKKYIESHYDAKMCFFCETHFDTLWLEWSSGEKEVFYFFKEQIEMFAIAKTHIDWIIKD